MKLSTMALSIYSKVAIVICLFVFIEAVKPTVFTYVDSRVVRTNLNDKPLPDIMHELLPDWRAHFIWVDYLMIVIMVLVAILSYVHSKLDVFLNVCIAFAMFNIIKFALNTITIHPDPSQMCKEKKDFNGLAGQCNDLFPSGHMAGLSAMLIGLWPHMSPLVRGASVCVVTIMWLGILAVRNHYTIDTVMSPLVMWFIWNVAGVHNL